MSSPGKRFRQALRAERPLQIVGTINAYCALLAKRAGYRAIYLSGAGVANASFGLPDLGMTGMSEVMEEVRRITAAVDLPLLVDADTGWGGAFNIARTVRELIRSGAAAMQIEDQVTQKRCGHRPNKETVDREEMISRISAAADARTDLGFFILARTDALQSEGLEGALDRSIAYVEAGADGIFAEAVDSLEDYEAFSAGLGETPLLANITEFGTTPLLTREQLHQAGVDMILYPLSAFRAMSQAATTVYETIRRDGSQDSVIPGMQTRDELYETLGYYDYEKKLDELFGEDD